MLIPMLALTLISVPDRAIGRCSAAWMSTAARVATSTAGRSSTVGPGQVGEQDEELVAALAGDDVLVADDVPDPCRHLDQQVVADGVAEAVVDELEAVQVDEADGDVACRRARPARRATSRCSWNSSRFGSAVSESW